MQATEPHITVEEAIKLGLTEEEFNTIIKALGRVPNFTELRILSVMWSEHCSCKNSIFWLKTLPRDGKRLLPDAAGKENAGLVDIGDGTACAFRIEFHNRPSTIDSYQGPATGVSGIHRNIVAMGGRPIAALNSLRFGNIDKPEASALIKEVVSDIGGYSNRLEVPTVGGEMYFEECYNQNILVNAMSVGIVEVGKDASAAAVGTGSPVYIVGSPACTTGASFTSADFGKDAARSQPGVEAGEPFLEKLLMEATLDAIQTGAITGMQNMGTAGIACATAEMSARGETGMHIDLDKVPTRQANMEPCEILLSESRERMLIVGKKGEERKMFELFDKWGVACDQIGEVTDTGRLEYFHCGERVAELPASALVSGGGAPVYQRASSRPAYLKKNEKFRNSQVAMPKDYIEVARQLFASPNIASKRWAYEQNNTMGGANSMGTNASSDAALVRIKNTRKALAVTIDCNAGYVFANPYVGAMIAVAKAARNIVASGGEPVAIANCLNFGNPHDPEVYWQFVQAIKGIGDACRRLNTPVTGSNVSFYNEAVSQGHIEPIFPTPVIGMLGLLDDINTQMTMDFKAEGQQIYMAGPPNNDMGSSEYLRRIVGITHSPAPVFDLDEEYHIQQNIKRVIQNDLLESAHNISEGGLFTALMESALAGELGFDIETDSNFRKDAYLFGESQSRILVTVSEAREDELVNNLNSHNVSFTKLGEITGSNAIIDGENYGPVKDWKYTSGHAFQPKIES
ncbi:MAG: phosphoribosylformylglycinamidine synthase subunit PurL [Phaeodactylibacter sp.]|nr:phosphoribosylformylglycinamidine synthase subunit PurL [Phaeodactylibacter sp.]